MIKFCFALLVAMCSSTLMAQDWIDKVNVPTPAEPLPEVEVFDPSIEKSPLDELVERMEAAVAEAKAAAAEAKAAAEVVRNQPVAMPESESRLSALELAVEQLKARKDWSEGEIRALAKEEAEKVMQATVKTASGETRTVGASTMQVTQAGYSGTFQLNPGERIIAVNGQPITQRAVVNNATVAATPTVQMQSVPQRQGVVRFWSMPSRTCTGPNCPK